MFVILVFCVFGITYLLRELDGPFDVLKKIRMLAGLKYVPVLGEDGEFGEEIEEIPDTKWGKFFSCFWCLSTWVSFVLCGIFIFVNKMSIFDWIYYSFGCVGAAGLLYEWRRSLKDENNT
jgi:hypothetical protein